MSPTSPAPLPSPSGTAPPRALRIALVAMPGAGKSTLGKSLARQLGMRFADADAEVERRVGMSVREYFDREGEPAFRDREQEVLDVLTRGESLVLATGGGAVLREANRDVLHQRCIVVYLRTTPEEIARRLRNDRTRPLLQVADPLARLRALFKERDPLYRRTAHFTLETGRPSVQALLQMVLTQLELAGHVDPFLVPSITEAPAARSSHPRKPASSIDGGSSHA